jgi:hypothetical protein
MSTSWRETQLVWYDGSTIQQDYDLEQFIINRNILSIEYFGDSDYLKLILEKETSPGQLCVYLANRPIKLSNIVSNSNKILKKLQPEGILYLSINKFLLVPEPQSVVVDDYDDAIYNYITTHVKSTLIDYYSGKNDGGKKFNAVHPLTRFYFQNANSI